MNRRTITIAVIAVLAIGVALVVFSILTTPHKAAAPPRNVVIAAMNIPAGAKVVPAMVTTEQKPSDQVEPTALSDPADAVGMLATADIAQGAAITPARLARPAPVPQGLQVAAGLRAVTIGIDQVKGLSGLLKPGDHVDVLAAPNRNYNQPQTFTIIRDARILAVGQDIGAPAVAPSGSPNPNPTPVPPPATTITLAVTPPQADLIMTADLYGTVRLALRSPHEPGRSLSAEAYIYPTPPPPVQAAPPPTPFGVQVVSGDQSTSVRP